MRSHNVLFLDNIFLRFVQMKLSCASVLLVVANMCDYNRQIFVKTIFLAKRVFNLVVRKARAQHDGPGSTCLCSRVDRNGRRLAEISLLGILSQTNKDGKFSSQFIAPWESCRSLRREEGNSARLVPSRHLFILAKEYGKVICRAQRRLEALRFSSVLPWMHGELTKSIP